MPISTLSVRAKGGLSMDQQANMEELIHHFVSHCPEGEPCVLPMRSSCSSSSSSSSSSNGGEGQQATPPWWMRDHANKCHLQLLITTEEEAELREMHAALSTSVTTAKKPCYVSSGALPMGRILIICLKRQNEAKATCCRHHIIMLLKPLYQNSTGYSEWLLLKTLDQRVSELISKKIVYM